MNKKCCHCFDEVSDVSKYTLCHGCKLPTHLNCLNLNSDEAALIKSIKSTNIKIYCNRCNVSISVLTEVKSMIAELKNSVNSRFAEIESLIKTSITNVEVQKEAILNESVERATKSRNIIIYNFPENNSAIDSISVDEVGQVNDILELCDKTLVVSPSSVKRIGKKSADKIRPLRVTLADSFAAKLCLKNKKLLLADKVFNKITITDDKTTHQLNFLKDLRAELKNRIDTGEKNLTIKYINKTPTITPLNPQKNL